MKIGNNYAKTYNGKVMIKNITDAQCGHCPN